MKKLLLPFLFISFSSFAIDYSNCQYGDLRGRLDENGNLVPREGEVIKSVKKKDGVEIVEFGWTDPRMKGTRNDTLKISRDSAGNIIGYDNIIDLSSLSKKEMNIVKEAEVYRQAFSDSPDCSYSSYQSTYVDANGNSTGAGGGTYQAGGGCSSVAVVDANGNYVPANFFNITKDTFKNFKTAFGDLTWEEFEKIRKDDKKRIQDRKKLAKQYSKWLDKAGYAVCNGEKISFEIGNGQCALSKVEKSLVSSKGNFQILGVAYDASMCSAIDSALKSVQKEVNSCNLADSKLNDYFRPMPNPNDVEGQGVKISASAGRSGNKINPLDKFQGFPSSMPSIGEFSYQSIQKMKNNCESFKQLSTTNSQQLSNDSSSTQQ